MRCPTCTAEPGQLCCKAVLARVAMSVSHATTPKTRLTQVDTAVRAALTAVAHELDNLARDPRTPRADPPALTAAAALLRQAAGHTVARPTTARPTPAAAVEDATVVDTLCALLNQGASGADFVMAAAGLVQRAGRPVIDAEGYEVSTREEQGDHGLTIGLINIGDTTVRAYQSLVAPHGVVVAVDPDDGHAAALAVDIGDARIYGPE